LALDLLRRIPINVGTAKIIDIGCGMGEFADIIKEIYPQAQVTCVDGAERCCNFVRQKGYETFRVNLENEKIPVPNEEFDIVISLEVIEHIWNTENYLTEVKRILKPGGYAIFTTPNYNCYHYRLYHALGRFEKCLDPRHKKYYTARSIIRELCKHFQIVETIGYCILPIKIKFKTKYLINFLSHTIGILARKQFFNHA
jgi:2-polyprenyl-3-methyl-5-hydroxy-6-metoxy-1,4-benzoquinol methylase